MYKKILKSQNTSENENQVEGWCLNKQDKLLQHFMVSTDVITDWLRHCALVSLRHFFFFILLFQITTIHWGKNGSVG